MLRGELLHPEILFALGGAGHGSQILITDGNYPHVTKTNPDAERVYLNLAPGVLNAVQVLKVLADAVPIEQVHVMATADGKEPPIWGEFAEILGPELPLIPIKRFNFYDAACGSDVALVVATGEQRIYANILLTIGVVQPPK